MILYIVYMICHFKIFQSGQESFFSKPKKSFKKQLLTKCERGWKWCTTAAYTCIWCRVKQKYQPYKGLLDFNRVTVMLITWGSVGCWMLLINDLQSVFHLDRPHTHQWWLVGIEVGLVNFFGCAGPKHIWVAPGAFWLDTFHLQLIYIFFVRLPSLCFKLSDSIKTFMVLK